MNEYSKSFMNALLSIDLITNSLIKDNSFDESYYLMNDKVMDLDMNIMLEIMELLDNNYTYDEINTMIENIDLSDKELKDDEIAFLKRDAKKILKIKYNQRGEK